MIDAGIRADTSFERLERAFASLEGLVCLGEDLLDGDLFEAKDLEGLNALVQAHILANPTADHALAVLPSTAFSEKRGSMINVTGRLQRLNKATEPPGNARDLWESLRDLTQAVKGGSNGVHLIEDVFKLMGESIDEFKDLSLSKIGESGIALIESKETIPLLEKERERIEKGLIVG